MTEKQSRVLSLQVCSHYFPKVQRMDTAAAPLFMCELEFAFRIVLLNSVVPLFVSANFSFIHENSKGNATPRQMLNLLVANLYILIYY